MPSSASASSSSSSSSSAQQVLNTRDEYAVKQLDEEIHRMDEYLKVSWREAQEKCASNMVGPQHKLLFLKCEDYHIELAALRLLKYWAKKVEIFGAVKAFEPPEEVLRDDMKVLQQVHLQWTGCFDGQGRGIISEEFEGLYRIRKESSRGQRAEKHLWRQSVLRVVWYISCLAASCPKVQERGVIYLCHAHAPSVFGGVFDKKIGDTIIEMFRRCLPLRLKCFHFVRPSLSFRFMLCLRWRPTVRNGQQVDECEVMVHVGSPSKVKTKLMQAPFHIPIGALSTSLGGDLHFGQ